MTTSGGGATGSTQEQTGRLADTARDRARDVTAATRDAAGGVKDTAAHGATAVTEQAATQARDLVDQARGELTSQASAQTRRLGETLRQLGGELRRMAESGEQGGMAAQAVGEAAHHVERIGDHVQGREFTDLLDDVRGFARRRPGTFLLGAAGLGLVVGRLGRGVRDAQQQPDATASTRGPVAEPYPAEAFPARSVRDTGPTTPGAPTIEPTARREGSGLGGA